MNKKNELEPDKNLKFAAITIISSTLLSIFAMLHHTTIGTHDAKEQVAEVIRESQLNKLVHGSMILVVVLTLASMVIYSRHRGFQKLTITVATLSFFIGSLSMVGAALINGFILPDFMAGLRSATGTQLEQLYAIRSLTWSANQTLANLGVIAMSTAITFWSLELFGAIKKEKAIAISGMLIGTGCGLSILFGWITLDLFGMTSIVIAQGVWYLIIAALMLSKSNQLIKLEN